VLRTDVLIDERYRLQDRLASGGMGDVWRATDESLGRTVAVKVLRPELLTDPTFGVRFRSEARMLAALRHPGVVGVYDFGESTGPDGAPITYLVMEYIQGEPLSQLLGGGEGLPAAQTVAIAAQAADALHAAHTAGIVHRDVKPGNLLLQADGSVILVDFGIARSTSANTSLTNTNAILGTAKYMAPEQASGQEVSPATDIYALGAVAYHCLAGHPPFTGDNPLEIAIRHVNDEPPPLPDHIPEPVREMVGRALNKDPADRYPSAAAFADAARAVAAAEMTAPATVQAATAGSAATTEVYADAAGTASGPDAWPAVPAAVAPPSPAGTARRGRQLAIPLLAVATAVALLLLGGLTTFLLLSNRDQDDSNTPGSNVSQAPESSPTTTQASQPGANGGASPTGQPGPAGNASTRAPEQTPERTPPPKTTKPDEPGLPTRLPTKLPTTILPTLDPPLPGKLGERT
jgi:eukaryotic-like serine/threonine-protein kinase